MNEELNIIKICTEIEGWMFIELWHDYKLGEDKKNIFKYIIYFDIDINKIIRWCYLNLDKKINFNIFS